MWTSSAAMSALAWSTRSSMVASRKAWWSLKRPTKASSSRPRLARRRVRASCAPTLGSRSPLMSAASMARPETPKMSLATTDSLIWASSSSLLHPLLLPGPPHHQVGPVAGQVPQPPDRRWRHEAGAQHLSLGHLGQPDRVQPVGLGPPRQVLDVLGIHQPD